MAIPQKIWDQMNIHPHSSLTDYQEWGDCVPESSNFGTKHFLPTTRLHFADENPSLQALAARDAALAFKIDQIITALEDDTLFGSTGSNFEYLVWRDNLPTPAWQTEGHAWDYNERAHFLTTNSATVNRDNLIDYYSYPSSRLDGSGGMRMLFIKPGSFPLSGRVNHVHEYPILLLKGSGRCTSKSGGSFFPGTRIDYRGSTVSGLGGALFDFYTEQLDVSDLTFDVLSHPDNYAPFISHRIPSSDVNAPAVVKIRNCEFKNNENTKAGGSAVNLDHTGANSWFSDMLIENSLFYNNTSALCIKVSDISEMPYFVKISNCIFKGSEVNSFLLDLAASSGTNSSGKILIENCLFLNGKIDVGSAKKVFFRNCVFGSGSSFSTVSGKVHFDGCEFAVNPIFNSGGALKAIYDAKKTQNFIISENNTVQGDPFVFYLNHTFATVVAGDVNSISIDADKGSNWIINPQLVGPFPDPENPGWGSESFQLRIDNGFFGQRLVITNVDPQDPYDDGGAILEIQSFNDDGHDIIKVYPGGSVMLQYSYNQDMNRYPGVGSSKGRWVAISVQGFAGSSTAGYAQYLRHRS